VNILIDENLPPVLARALNELFKNEHTVIHIRERFGPAVKDVEWIQALSREGRWIVISADRRITRNKAEYNVFRASKLIGFFMSRSLFKSKLTKQAERLLAVWDNMIELAERVEGGAMFELPMKSTARFPQLKP
jgi:hypothetical protein